MESKIMKELKGIENSWKKSLVKINNIIRKIEMEEKKFQQNKKELRKKLRDKARRKLITK